MDNKPQFTSINWHTFVTMINYVKLKENIDKQGILMYSS